MAKVLVETSARHVHLTEEHIQILFGEGGFPVAPIYYYTQLYCKDASIGNVGFTSLGYFFFQYASKR